MTKWLKPPSARSPMKMTRLRRKRAPVAGVESALTGAPVVQLNAAALEIRWKWPTRRSSSCDQQKRKGCCDKGLFLVDQSGFEPPTSPVRGLRPFTSTHR
jgi:hypothetical protein